MVLQIQRRIWDRHYHALHICHSETMDEQTNFTQACIRSDNSNKRPPRGSARTAQIFGNEDRASARKRGAEQEKADTLAAYTSHFLFLQLLELSVPQHSQRKKEQDLHLSSRHSARNTLLGQYFCNSLSTRARLLEKKNANQDATASLSRRLGAKGSQTTSPVSFCSHWSVSTTPQMGFVFHIGLKNQSGGFHSETVRVSMNLPHIWCPYASRPSLSLEHSSTESRCQVHTELFIKNRGFQNGIQDDRVGLQQGRSVPRASLRLWPSVHRNRPNRRDPTTCFSTVQKKDTKQSWQGWANFCNKMQHFTMILFAWMSHFSYEGFSECVYMPVLNSIMHDKPTMHELTRFPLLE